VKDLRDIPKRVLKNMRVVAVGHMDEVLRVALAVSEPSEFLKEPSVAVDWRVPGERRERSERRTEAGLIPVASAVPPASTPPPSQVEISSATRRG
jgi:ATP-dependent Lon protease